jgi:hypothetical protein
VNAEHATLTGLATAQTGSTVEDTAPNAPAAGSFDLILQAVAGGALGNSGTPYTLTISAIDLTAVTQGWPTQTSTRPSTPPTGGNSAVPDLTTSAPRPRRSRSPAARWPATRCSAWPP